MHCIVYKSTTFIYIYLTIRQQNNSIILTKEVYTTVCEQMFLQETRGSVVLTRYIKRINGGFGMKRQISSIVIASTILAGSAFTPVALEEVSAKTVHQQQKAQNVKVVVDGKEKTLSFTTVKNHKLYSVDQLSKLMSATYKYNSKTKTYVVSKKVGNKAKKLEYTADSSNAVVNGKKTKLTLAPKLVGKKLFVDADSFAKALGGDFAGDFLATEGLVSGDSYDPQWVDASTLLITNDNTKDSRSILVNTNSKKQVYKVNATELAVSPNGKQAIYADENGIAHLVDLVAKKVTKLGEDDAVKSEFVWSNDGQKVYFLSGDKLQNVGSINIADGVISTINSDKLNYKSDLHLSADGKKLIYIAAKEASTTFTQDPTNPVVDNIDTTGTEPQIYQINLDDAKPAAKAITSTPDNKVFPGFLANGDVVYLSAEVDSDQLPELKIIKEGQPAQTLVSGKNIISSTVTPNGDVYILVAEKNGYSVIYKVDPSTQKLFKVAQTKLKLDSFTVSDSGKSVAATTPGVNGDAVLVLKNGVFEVLTK